jgi:outer membrane protein TolC
MKLAWMQRALALALLAATGASLAAAAERTLTLQDAIGMALQRSEALVIEREGLRAATFAIETAQGAYDQYLEVEGALQRAKDPTSSLLTSTSLLAPETRTGGVSLSLRQLLPTGGALSLRGSGVRQRTDDVRAALSPAYGTQVGVELRQPLLRELAIDGARFSVWTAEADRDGVEASVRRTANETVAAVDRAYWVLVAARLAADVRAEAVTLAEEQLQQTHRRLDSGDVPRTELAQPQAELERRRGELLASREAAAKAENALKLLILADADAGWGDRLTPSDSMDVTPAPIDPATSLARALAGRPELALAGAALERRRVETRFAASNVRPSLDAVLSYDRFGIAGDGFSSAAGSGGLNGSFRSLRDNEFNTARVALVLGLPVRNSAARAHAEAARSVQRRAEAQLALVRKTIRAEVLDAVAALETAGQRIEAARSGRRAAEIQLAAEKDRYRTGLSTNFLVLTRQNDLSLARLAEISAVTDYRTARTELARADGTLIEERGIHVDTKGP